MTEPIDRGPWLQWKANGSATPPPEADEWKAIIARVGRRLRVVLLSRPSGAWHVHSAFEMPPLQPGHTHPVMQIDRALTSDRRFSTLASKSSSGSRGPYARALSGLEGERRP